MKKVLLINSNIEFLPYPVAPLGISLVASSLLNKYEVKVFDFATDTTDNLIGFITEFRPDYIGISLRNIDNVTMRRCKWYINQIRESIVIPIKKKFDTPIILGGSGFSIAPKEVLEYFNADYGISGEAEEAFPELLSQLDKDVKDISIPGVVSKTGNGFKPRAYTKGDLIAYYDQMAPFIIPYLKDRPIMLHRFPEGIEGIDFYQKNINFKPPVIDH